MDSPDRLTLLFICLSLIIACGSASNLSLFYQSSGLIVNHNYTKDFLVNDCEPCKNLSLEVQTGFWKMFQFFDKYNLFAQYNTLWLNMTAEGVFFSPPSLGTQDINATELKKKIDPKKQEEERGLFFIIVMKLDFNLTNPSKDLYNLKSFIINACYGYLRNEKYYQLNHDILLNDTAFVFQEIPESFVTNYLEILREKHRFTPTTILRKHDDIPEIHQRILSIISYIGCALSAVGLILTIITIMLSRKLRRLRQNQILASMCLSLLAAIFLFTFGLNGLTAQTSLDLCKAVAALLHYFLLSSIVWMSIEAYNLYQDLVKVFDTSFISQTEFICRAGVVGWIIPAIIVAITVLAQSNSYGFHVTTKYNETLCWMNADAFYGAFLSPVLLLMIINIVIFIVVMREIYKIPQVSEKINRLSHFRATVSVFVLLGVNWVFAGLAATVGTLVFHYLFTISCSFQGYYIFILHGAMKKDFRDAWRLLTTKNRVFEIIRTSSLGNKTHSMSVSQNSPSGLQGRENPISLGGSGDVDSGIEIQINFNLDQSLT